MSPLKSNSVENFKNVLENLYRDKLYWGFKENVSWKSFDLYETFWRVEQLSVDVSNFDIGFVSDFAILPFSSFDDKKLKEKMREKTLDISCVSDFVIYIFFFLLFDEKKKTRKEKNKNKNFDISCISDSAILSFSSLMKKTKYSFQFPYTLDVVKFEFVVVESSYFFLIQLHLNLKTIMTPLMSAKSFNIWFLFVFFLKPLFDIGQISWGALCHFYLPIISAKTIRLIKYSVWLPKSPAWEEIPFF